ncbi:MAG: hypothetical protein PHX70_02810 [Clostridium sp.]|nr:hypothetical protein [Clostridium sp.]
MKRFLWFNIEKLKNDPDYFLMSYILIIFVQLGFWTKIHDLSSIVFGSIFSILFLYLTFIKKDFTLKDIWKLFWKINS